MTAGEDSILVTNQRDYYERAMLLSQSPGRLHQELTDPRLQRFAETGLGFKCRIYNHPGDLPVTEAVVPRLIALPAFPNPGSEALIDQ